MLPIDDSMEGAMGYDKEKSIVEKTIETVKEMATSVTDAAKHAMEPEPLKPGDQVVTMPLMDAGLMADPIMPPFVVIRRQKKTAPEKAVKRSAKKSAGPINSTKKKSSAKKIATKSTKKAAKKSAAKKNKKTAKKSSVRSAKKATRKPTK
jgi:hypothetical protein